VANVATADRSLAREAAQRARIAVLDKPAKR
jgi:hypothetical protein